MRYEPGSRHPFHKREIAKVRHIDDVRSTIGGRLRGSGTTFFYIVAGSQEELFTRPGGQIAFARYSDLMTDGRTLCDVRFIVDRRKAPQLERTDDFGY